MTKKNIETVLQMDGILAKGYGMVAKFPMRDTALKIKDKGIYAYLCALSGGGIKTWPSRSKILADLHIGKSVFYNSMERLLKEGYLTRTERRIHGEHGMWTRTIYTIQLNPKRYQEHKKESKPSECSASEEGSTISVQGMLHDGWGFAPRLVMQDPRLSIKEKALYAYILTYAAAGRRAYPDVATITYHLGICEETYRNLINHVCSLGYIIRYRNRKANGQLGGYDYYIPPKPRIIEETQPTPLKPDTVKPDTVKPDTEFPCLAPPPLKPDTAKPDTVKPDTEGFCLAPPPSKPDTVKPDTVQSDPEAPCLAPPPSKPDTVKPDTVQSDAEVSCVAPPPLKPDTANPDTVNPPTAEPPTSNQDVRKIQDFSNTNISNTRTFNYQPSNTSGASCIAGKAQESMQTSQGGGMDGWGLREKVQACSGIPKDILCHPEQVTEVLRYLCGTDWTQGESRYLDEEKQQAFAVVMKGMLRLCTQKCSRISNLVLTREQIVDRLNLCLEKDADGVYMEDFLDFVTTDYVQALQSRREEGKTPVRNPVNYACSVIWSATDGYQRMKWLEEQEQSCFTIF